MIREIMGVPDYPTIKDNIVSIALSDVSLEATYNSIKKTDLDPATFYKLNNYGNRCDDLTKVHDGKHILFSGCSVTTGEGMALDYVWAKVVYDKISKDEKTSGYFNISQPGGSIIGIVNQAMTYIGEFGSPDVIFLNLPTLDREDRYLRQGFEDIEAVTEDATAIQIFGKYEYFAKMCKQRGIQLITFTWDDMAIKSKTPDFRRDFTNFYQYDMSQMYLHMYEFEQANKDHKLRKYFEYALDDSHPGIAMQDFYANFAYNIYRRNNVKKG